MNPEWNISTLRLNEAPELAVLVTLDASLEATVLALLAQHQEYWDSEPYYGYTPDSYIANSIITLAHGLRDLLDGYQNALAHEKQRRLKAKQRKGDQEIPF